MLKKAAIVSGAAAALMALAPVAYADSAENDGINILNDNNISAPLIQACGNNILGVLAPTLALESNNCVNAPIADNPSSQG